MTRELSHVRLAEVFSLLEKLLKQVSKRCGTGTNPSLQGVMGMMTSYRLVVSFISGMLSLGQLDKLVNDCHIAFREGFLVKSRSTER